MEEIFVMIESLCILIAETVIGIYTWEKMSQNYIHTVCEYQFLGLSIWLSLHKNVTFVATSMKGKQDLLALFLQLHGNLLFISKKQHIFNFWRFLKKINIKLPYDPDI